MSIEDAIKKLEKAKQILIQKKVIFSLQRLMDIPSKDFISIKIKNMSNDYYGDEKHKIKIAKSFDYNDNKYDLYYLNERIQTGLYKEIVLGDFKLLFNNEIVLDTNYYYERVDLGMRYRISLDKEVIVIKLKEWVEEIPILAREEEDLMSEKISLEQKQRIENKEKNINSNIDLGKYD